MRYKGKQLSGPKIETIAIPREDGDIIFQAQAVMDYEPFYLICPKPDAPEKILPGNKRVRDPEHPEYKLKYSEWLEQKQLWMILQSLKVSEFVEWETVDMSDPATYSNYWDELQRAGFNEMERFLIRNLALQVNSVDSDKMEEARQRFLQNRAVQQDQPLTSQMDGVQSTPSGELVSDLVSSLRA